MVRAVRKPKDLSPHPEDSLTRSFVDGGVTYAVSGPYLAEDLNLWPVFFHWAWQAESFTGEHQISVPKVLEAFHHLGYELEMRELWESMRRLSQTRLEWLVVENQKKKAVGFCVLLASAMLEEDQPAVLSYTIPECLRQMIPDPEALARIQRYLLEAPRVLKNGPEDAQDRSQNPQEGAQDG